MRLPVLIFLIIPIVATIQEDDYYDEEKQETEEPEDREFNLKNNIKYEVTENISDIPNTRQDLDVIITNYTLNKPLNIAVTNSNIADNNHATKVTIDKLGLDGVKNRKYVSLLHIRYEDDPIVVHNHYNVLKNIRGYIHGFKKGVLNGLHSYINRPDDLEFNDGAHLSNVIAGPIVFLNKLQRKSFGLAQKVHSRVFGNKFNDAD